MSFDPSMVLVPETEGLISETSDEQLVTVAYCHYGTVASDFAISLLSMFQYDQQHGRHWDAVCQSKSPYIPMARNEVVETFLTQRFAHWLLFLDNDMIFPADTIDTLLALADPEKVPILGGLYLTPLQPDSKNKQHLEYLPTWTHAGDGGGERAVVMSVNFDEPLMQLHTCGMGCTLIHRSVLEVMQEAYSHDPWKWFDHDRVQVGDREPERLGEDLTFCTRARDLGFTVWGTPSVRCGHIKTHVLHPLSYKHDRQPQTRIFPVLTK